MQKCHFFQQSVQSIGHVNDAEGVYTFTKKVKAITDTHAPRNFTELRTFRGLVNYYSKFVTRMASLLHTVYNQL